MQGRCGTGLIFADGKSLTVDFSGELMRFENVTPQQVNVNCDIDHGHGYGPASFRIIRGWEIQLSLYAEGVSRSDQVDTLKDLASRLSVAELFDVINEKLEFRGMR